MGRHQVDLVELCNIPVEYEGKTYLYVLSVIDVFSRFLWLRPLTDKTSLSVSMELRNIYFEYAWGCPKVIQCDRGIEFKGYVNHLCQLMGTKMIRSRPRHPQSQGKLRHFTAI